MGHVHCRATPVWEKAQGLYKGNKKSVWYLYNHTLLDGHAQSAGVEVGKLFLVAEVTIL